MFEGWRRCIVESTILVCLLVLIDNLYFDGNRFADVNPRPLWIPVLLMSVQYGLAGGVFAAFASTLALYSAALPSQAATQDFYAYSRLVVAEPTSWLACALVLGGLSSLQLAHAAEERRQGDEARATAEDLGRGLRQALTDLARLEREIAAETRTAGAIARAFGALDPAGAGSLAASCAEFARLVIGTADLTIHLRGADGSAVQAHAGTGGPREPPPEAGFLPEPDRSGAPCWFSEAGADPAWPAGILVVPIPLPAGAGSSGAIVAEGFPEGHSAAAAARRAADVARGVGALLGPRGS
ncbi:MAG: hypothetical protein PGN34_26025 [Methylobacterium frigidaeris]